MQAVWIDQKRLIRVAAALVGPLRYVDKMHLFGLLSGSKERLADGRPPMVDGTVSATGREIVRKEGGGHPALLALDATARHQVGVEWAGMDRDGQSTIALSHIYNV